MKRDKKQPETILVVDDSAATVEMVSRTLASFGYLTLSAGSVGEAVGRLQDAHVDLVITDHRMPKVSGLDLVRHVRENHLETGVIMITGYATIAGAVEAVKTGAEEYLAKPFTDDELRGAVERSLANLHARQTILRDGKIPEPVFHGLYGQSKVMRDLYHAIRKTASSPITVLISGESGTGKELAARAIHYQSNRASAPFIPVNCGGIPENLLESELFGHLKGAVTGATETRAGFFQTADGGTIFLDEISETSLAMQVKLLRVVQEKNFCMVGSTRPLEVDLRIISATNKDLPALVRKGLFREDLFFRLNIINIEMPPLRDREEDVLFLAGHFAAKFSRELGRTEPRFTDDALDVLRRYPWPGNVRELENLVQRVLVMAESDIIEVRDLPAAMRFSSPRGFGLDRTLAEVESDHVRAVLEGVGGNKTQAARILAIDRKTLRQKLKPLEGGTDA